MNIRQKIILRCGAAIAALFLLFPNFVIEIGEGASMRGLGHNFILSPPSYGFVHSFGLIAEISAVAVICAMLWWSEKE